MNLDLADRLIKVAERLQASGDLTPEGWKFLQAEIQVAQNG